MTRPRTLLRLALAATLVLAPRLRAGERAPRPGDQVPDFAFTDLDGHQHHLSDFAGQYVLLDFWATWCRPCLKEVPDLKQADEQFRSRGLAIIGMNSDKKPEEAQRFVQEKEVPWLQSSSPSTNEIIHHVLNVQYYPTLILLSPQGKILAISMGEKPPLFGPSLLKTLEQTLPPGHP
jgi:thiol-disulfide isomerase/thioredoxin